ncbi:septum-promoting GTP-binding protein 1-like [Impatiens glandulifera]|uniref:septum-promoting GTP-binding protein 1-like n=1 Tax=Impatiens glandulifera TaxID=253017 RepID=UPI001FB13563|nr:septum-promoting GTP-binding protein 1-like [Impatiens glandulifera]
MTSYAGGEEVAGKMKQLCRRVVRVNIRWKVIERFSIFRQFFRFIWDRILVCSTAGGRQGHKYRRLSSRPTSSLSGENLEPPDNWSPMTTTTAGGGGSSGYDSDSDLVSLKISVLGDCQIGKTSFVIKYVGDDPNKIIGLDMKGLNLMDKTLFVQGARIAFRIWDVGGDSMSWDQVPMACKDAVAILFMFDLTSRCTLNSVIGWYTQARKWNQAAIPILIGTKFDDFVQLPPDLQTTIIIQARAYARMMNASLFFSSSTHNINVSKIFKFITAKLFNLSWTIDRNLNPGEPIIDHC